MKKHFFPLFLLLSTLLYLTTAVWVFFLSFFSVNDREIFTTGITAYPFRYRLEEGLSISLFVLALALFRLLWTGLQRKDIRAHLSFLSLSCPPSSEDLKKKDLILSLAILLLFVLTALPLFLHSTYPYQVWDEAGYWGHAATFAGRDWSALQNLNTWYSYGYSLLLAPLISLSSDYISLYRSAILLNFVLFLLSFFLLKRFLSRLFPEMNPLLLTLLSGLSLLYTPLPVRVNGSLPETLLLTLLLVLLLLFFRLLEAGGESLRTAFFLGICLACLYWVHNRMVSAIPICVLFCLYFRLKKQLSPKSLLAFLSSLTVLMTGGAKIKAYLTGLRPLPFAGNDYATNGEKLSKYFSDGRGLLRLLRMVLSHHFGSMVSSLGLSFLGLFALLFLLASYQYYRRRLCGKETVSLSAYPVPQEQRDLLLLPSPVQAAVLALILALYLSGLAVSAVSTYHIMRYEHAVYTRYTDPYMPLLFPVGLVFLCRLLLRPRKKSLPWLALLFLSFLCLSLIGARTASFLMEDVMFPELNSYNGYAFSVLSTYLGLDLGKYALLVSGLFLLLLTFFYLLRSHPTLPLCLSAIVLSLAFTTLGNRMRQGIADAEHYHDQTILLLTGLPPDSPLYQSAHLSRDSILISQFVLKDRTIPIYEETQDIPPRSLLLVENGDASTLYPNLSPLTSSDRLTVLHCR